ncbi:acetaldehyde dehydrogenase (acetylating) (plasmid) [Streptomyces sp. BI20]|uniref:acetaldehyde dehydrogenase (acetylating) n=1 Tax=Streptomyces sp. BI20 TaxID=3403460 RepID=UPI003C70ACDE
MKAAIIGSGNIGTDLLVKIVRGRGTVTAAAMIGIDPGSAGLARARRFGVPTSADGVEGLIAMDGFDTIDLVFDATSAAAHHHNAAALAPHGKILVDLTPAALGPYVVPVVNLDAHLDARNLNMVTCGGQATVPVVAAVSAVTPVHYAEIVASIASRSAGPGTRANIDEFTETTSRALEQVGGAARGKAIIVLNPAEPPLLMRDTVHCVVGDAGSDTGGDAGGDTGEDTEALIAKIGASVHAMVDAVAGYVPGYRLKQEPQFRVLADGDPLIPLAGGGRLLVSVYLEVEGAAHHLPAYAGNLDIMTSAALRTAERLAERTPPR